MMNENILDGVLLDEQVELTLSDLCHACSSHAEWIMELVEEGVLEPIGNERDHWRFSSLSLQRARVVARLRPGIFNKTVIYSDMNR